MKKKGYVTGAERGLGLELVKVLLEHDYKVYAGKYLKECNELLDVKEKYQENLVILQLDITNEKSVEQAASAIASDTSELNLLINNAGIAIDRSGTILEKQYFDDIRALFETNSLGTLRVTQSVIQLLLKAESKTLVNISSIAGSVGSVTRTNQFGYTMSKCSVNMQSKIIYNHLKNQGLRVLALHPGWMYTSLFGDLDRMKGAPYKPSDSARNIFKIIQSDAGLDGNIYLNCEGKPLPW